MPTPVPARAESEGPKAESAAPLSTPPPGAEDPKEARIRALEGTIARLEQLLGDKQKEERIATLETTVQALERRVQELSARAQPVTERPAAPGAVATAPATETPSPAQPEPTPGETVPTLPPPTGGGATLLPNISAIGNVIYRGGPRGTEGRGRFNTEEVELAFQDRVAPNLRADFFLSSEKGEEWKTGVEEGYLTWTNPLGIANLSTRFGKLRTPFGKLNPTHPHTWRFIDQPSAISALLGPDGLNADGAVLQYLLPIPGIFANVEVGGWQTTSESEGGLGFGGMGRDAVSGRLWFGKEVGKDRELELGFSRYQGRGTPEGLTDRRRLALNGIDLTFRAFPSAYRRIVLQSEVIQHHTGGPGSDRDRLGGYLDLAYRPNQYWEGGIRGDYTQFPFPTNGQETVGSAYLTHFLTEQTSLRLQLRHGSRPARSSFNEVFLQFLFGFGPHSHLLQ